MTNDRHLLRGTARKGNTDRDLLQFMVMVSMQESDATDDRYFGYCGMVIQICDGPEYDVCP